MERERRDGKGRGRMISHDEVVIIVPVYRERLSECEQISLNQLKRVLNRYPIAFMAPNKMRGFCSNNGLQAIFFPDYHMESVESYSGLMISPAFYHRFDYWRYMLIYQLDAFVFRDELLDFCNLGYDFIGAPWPYWYDNSGVKSHVGNGGLSLRKISSCERITSDKKIMADWRRFSQNRKLAEDLFFAHAAGNPETGFVSAPIEVAVHFSQEEEVRRCYRNGIKRQLPFGCHGWTKRTFYSYWKPIIESYGYYLPDIWPGDTMLGLRQASIARMLTNRIIRGEKRIKAKEVMRKMLDNGKRYAIHGGGVDGVRCLKLLQSMGFSTGRVYDRHTKALSAPECKAEPLPIEEELKRSEEIIIIATFNYEHEVSSYYKGLGLVEGREYLLFSKLEMDFTNAVYGFLR